MSDLETWRAQQADNLEALRTPLAESLKAIRAQQELNFKAVEAQIKLNNDNLRYALNYLAHGAAKKPKKEFIDPLRYC